MNLGIVPFGEISKEILILLKGTLKNTYNLSIHILPKTEIPSCSYNYSRCQYLGEKILEFLNGKSDDRVLGVVNVDLYAKGLNFIFGQAELGGRVAVVSIHRLNPKFYGFPPNERLFFERIEKESIHEVGHMIGLTHCSDKSCVMSFSNSIIEVDQKSKKLCKKCIKFGEIL